MAEKVVASSVVNEIKWRHDIASFRKVRDEVKRFKKELQSAKSLRDSIAKPIPTPKRPKTDNTSGGSGTGGRKPKVDPEIKAKERARQKEARDKERLAQREARWAQQRTQRIKEFQEDNAEVLKQAKKLHVTESLAQQKKAKSVRELNRLQRKHLRVMKAETREHKKQTNMMKAKAVLQRRMSGSLLQMAGGFVSGYAVTEAAGYALRTGMDFEAVNKTLLAVSDTQEEAKDNFKFVRAEAQRLGIDLVQAGKGYSRMLAAAGEGMTQQEVRDTFSAVAEVGTVLGLSQDDMTGSIRAIQQIMGKGRVQAEEMRQQLGKL